MTRTAFLHQNATARHLGALRIWVFAMWIADLVKDPITDLAAVPFSYFQPVGVLRWLPLNFWRVVHTEQVLRLWWAALLLLLVMAALGTRHYRVVAGAACVLLTGYQGMIYGFGEVTHAELVALYTVYILAVFPSADALAIRRVRGPTAPGPVYQAALLAATITLLVTYLFTGVRRIFAGGIDIFLDGTILSMVADGAATPDHFQRAVGLWTLASPLAAMSLQVGFVAVTAFEILSLLCLSSTWFRRCWLGVMLPFHVLSWPLLQTLFLHNILLICALLIDVDGSTRRLLNRISRVTPAERVPGVSSR